MNALRTLLSDLVEKRLWPLAVLLVGALVAVPFVLAKSPATAPAPGAGTTPAATAATASSAPTVEVVAAPSRHAPLRGRAKNPFHQQHVGAKRSNADGGGTPPVDTAPPAGTGTPSPDDGNSPSGGAPTPPPKPQKTYAVAAVDVRFGKASGNQHTHENLPRLRALPSATRPIVIFLGMRKGLDTAVFLLSSDVHAQGDGTCTPSRAECTAIEVREGDVVLLDVTGADGRVTQYELDLLKITVSHTTSKPDAEQAYARVSARGARLLARRIRASARNSAAGGRPDRIPFRYAVARGVLHIAPFLSQRVAGRAR
jgi:hypothetical protein